MSLRPTVKQPIDISSYTGEITRLPSQARKSHQDTTVKCRNTTGHKNPSWARLIQENNRAS